MVGREIAELHFEARKSSGKRMLDVEGLSLPSPPGSGRPALQQLNFHVEAGEVVGIAGLLGAGRTELLESLFGATPTRPRGSIVLNGSHVQFEEPAEAIAAGVALVTEDRKSLGLFAQMTVAENITIRSLDAVSQFGIVNPNAENRADLDSIARLSIKTDGGAAAITSLSGGNQQKCIIARWLLINPKLLLLDEPTRGIDVGAKAEIYALIRRLAEAGMAVLMTSSELPELLTVSDRILVLCEGRLTANFTRAEANEEVIMHAATQFLDRAAG
jgi:ABC-type sugar transport system ATPase subunit